MTIHDSALLIFKAITSFIRDLNEIYGDRHKPLMLYAHLIEKTGIIHEEPIRKHLSVFQKFLTENEDGIVAKDSTKILHPLIHYSDKVFIDMKIVFGLAEGNVSDQESIWQHLLTLSALLNPSSQAKEILRQDKDKNEADSSEDDFLTGLIDKVGKYIDPTSMNPMDSMNNLMTSGVFTDLMSSMDKGIGDGTLDMNKMVGSLQRMIGSLSTVMEMETGASSSSSSPSTTTTTVIEEITSSTKVNPSKKKQN